MEKAGHDNVFPQEEGDPPCTFCDIGESGVNLLQINDWHYHHRRCPTTKKGQRTMFETISGWNLTLFILFVLTTLTSDAINPGCRCIRFVSTFGKDWGEVSSPDYPSGYPPGIPCLLYLFTAPEDFIVQLNFSRIHLPLHPNGCHSGDYLKLYLHLDSGDVNESTPWNTQICGERTNETYYSASRHLVIQFHSGSSQLPVVLPSNSHSGTSPFGFHGHFRFLNASQFESNGRLVAGTKCDFLVESRNYSSPNGKFFSPNYPSMYPHNVMCHYTFKARLKERVKVVFESVALVPGIYSCLNKTDMIRVYDGRTSSSPVVAVICNVVSDYEVLSTGQEMLVEFIVGGNSDSTGKGFRAKFHFIKVIYEDPYDPMRFNLQHYFPKLDVPKSPGEDGQPQASTLAQNPFAIAIFCYGKKVPQCDQVIYSDSGINGSLSSPSYPNPYQPKSHCRFDLIGHGRQRVQISFVDFHLFHTEETVYAPYLQNNYTVVSDKKCAFSDTISAYIYVNGRRIRILEHCGLHPPPDMMSNDHRMALEFNAKASTTTPPFRGFYAHYAFVEDFGVKSGLQAKEYPCAFIFNISTHPNGTIYSPNFPGLYPRATECHYYFHGNYDKRFVELAFDHFDIAGNYPCDSEWDDYLEYSDFMSFHDTRFSRRCGHQSTLFYIGGGGPPTNFFRLTFRSSDDGWADGTGFRARFTFTEKINHVTASHGRCERVTICLLLEAGLAAFTMISVR